jgi:hypothetical protein
MRTILRATAAASALVLIAIVVRTVNDSSSTSADPPPETTTVSTPAPRACGTVLDVDANGTPLDQDRINLVVKSVHDAACRHDSSELSLLMEPEFGGRTAEEAIADLLAWRPKGIAFDSLAAVLETAPHIDQGGLTYCTPHGVIASFDRGTITRSGGWSDFQMIRFESPPCG